MPDEADPDAEPSADADPGADRDAESGVEATTDSRPHADSGAADGRTDAADRTDESRDQTSDDPAGTDSDAAGPRPAIVPLASDDTDSQTDSAEPATAETTAPSSDGADRSADGAPTDPGRVDAPTDAPIGPPSDGPTPGSSVPEDVRKYDRFQKIDGGTYERANDFLRDRTYITAREWAIARLCADFRTETGVEMTKIGENLPELVPFMTDTYTPQAVNQARHSFEEKIRTAGATFLYGAMCDFFTAEELDDVMYEATEVAKFLLEVEGVDLSVEEELEAEDRISGVMREVREHSAALRHDEVTCPECGHHIQADE